MLSPPQGIYHTVGNPKKDILIAVSVITIKHVVKGAWFSCVVGFTLRDPTIPGLFRNQ